MLYEVITVKYYETFAEEQSEKGIEGYARLDPERPHILRIIKGCAERKGWQDSINLIGQIDRITSYNVCYTKLLRRIFRYEIP